MKDHLRISLFQMDSVPGDVQANTQKAVRAAEEAARRGSDLMILPEYWSTGYDLKRMDLLASSADAGFFMDIRNAAASLNLSILCTGPRREKDQIRNTAVLYDSQGKEAGQYDKIHLFSVMEEERVFTPGQTAGLCGPPWEKTGMLICYDLRFPELARKLTTAGAELLLIPAYWPAPRLEHWRLLLRARAVENQVWVAACNRARLRDKLDFGYSVVIGPDGEVAAEAGMEEILLTVDIDLSRVRTWRKAFPALRDRKPDTYFFGG